MNTSPLKTVVNSIKHWHIPLIIGAVLVASGIYVFTTPLASYLDFQQVYRIRFVIFFSADL